MTGTLVWKWLDDDGRVHTFRIPDSFYVPSGKMRLLSPQHLSRALKKQGKDKFPQSTSNEVCTLDWGNNGQFRRTIPIDRKTNVFTFDLAPGYDNFCAYCAQCHQDEYDELEGCSTGQ